MSKHLVATAAITVLALIGFGTIASAAWADTGPAQPGVVDTTYLGTPDHPFVNGLCWQPGSLPPFLVPCDSPEATTPYVSGQTPSEETADIYAYQTSPTPPTTTPPAPIKTSVKKAAPTFGDELVFFNW